MMLPKWAKIALGVLTWTTIGVILAFRMRDISNGATSTLDCVLFIAWLGLMLAPIFPNVSLFGLELRRELRTFREDLDRQFTSLRAEIRTTMRTDVHQQVFLHGLSGERDEVAVPSQTGALEAQPRPTANNEEQELRMLGQQLPNYAGTVLILLCQEGPTISPQEFRESLMRRRPTVQHDWNTRFAFALNWLSYYRLIQLDLDNRIAITDRGRRVAETRFRDHVRLGARQIPN